MKVEIKRTMINKSFIKKIATKYFQTAKRFQKFRDDLTQITVVRFYDVNNTLLGKITRENRSELCIIDIK